MADYEILGRDGRKERERKSALESERTDNEK
jgi:hypothetical protein